MGERYIRTTELLPVLLVSADREHEMALRAILDGTSHAVYHVSTCKDATRLMDDLDPDVVLVEADVPAGDWRRLLDHVLNLPRSPEVIVFSRIANVRLWAEVLTLGGYDLLDVPFEPKEVQRTISQASQFWASEIPLGVSPLHQAARSATAA